MSVVEELKHMFSKKPPEPEPDSKLDFRLDEAMQAPMGSGATDLEQSAWVPGAVRQSPEHASQAVRWIDIFMPQDAVALAYDAGVQARLDRSVLAVLKSADVTAAVALRDISLGFAAAQRELQARVFWKISAAYFEAVSLALCPLDVYGKRAASRVLLQYRALARGDAQIPERLVQDLLFFCAQAEPKFAADAPVLAAVRTAFGLTQSQPIAGETPQLGRVEDQVKVIGSLRIAIPLYNVYLNEADEWSRALLTELSEWALELHRPVLDSTVALARSLADSSAMVGFVDLSGVARTLEQAMRHVQPHAKGRAQHVPVFLEVAEDIRRLLHQFAAGFQKQPDQKLLDALQAILETEFPTSAAA